MLFAWRVTTECKHKDRNSLDFPKRALFLLSYFVISAMENRVVWKIINRTHQDVDFVTDASESENRNILYNSRDFPLTLKLPL